MLDPVSPVVNLSFVVSLRSYHGGFLTLMYLLFNNLIKCLVDLGDVRIGRVVRNTKQCIFVIRIDSH